MFNIVQDKSSAHHPSGNRCIENAVQRIKRAIGDRKIEDAMTDIIALNHGHPYNSKTLTPRAKGKIMNTQLGSEHRMDMIFTT